MGSISRVAPTWTYASPNLRMLTSCAVGLAAQGIGNTEIQSIGDIANPNTNEVVIFVEGKGQDESALESSREKCSPR